MDGEIGEGWVDLFLICKKNFDVWCFNLKRCIYLFCECMYDVRYIFIVFR